GGALDCIGSALSSLQDAVVFRDDAERIGGLLAELDDATSGLRRQAETIAEDPERLEAVVERRRLIADLRRRHGDGTVAGLLAEHTRLAERLAALEAADATSATLAVELDLAQDDVDRAAAIVAATRREAAPRLAAAVAAELHDLAMPAARFEIAVEGEPPGDAVEMRFTANPGTTPAALAKVASGGELARAMLALRLVAASDQETVVFDEVDAGIGGTAAIAVGRALARLGRRRQVLVVTHLAQVAAAADHQVGVVKTVEGDTTSTTASMLTGDDRVVELSRMLSGSPESESGRMHARELLVGSEACR
ncbi:MAG: DNA repair protein RecN, partial [Actinobacteria bacterium]|nr:DNA repair protein RecN [Actinomycetota bacterium]